MNETQAAILNAAEFAKMLSYALYLIVYLMRNIYMLCGFLFYIVFSIVLLQLHFSALQNRSVCHNPKVPVCHSKTTFLHFPA